MYIFYFIAFFSFLLIFAIRKFFIKRKISIFLYHFSLFIYLFIAVIVGIDVQKAGYARLEEFIVLEKNNQLITAKKNPQQYASMLQIDLQQFKNSDEFRIYLKMYDKSLDKWAAVGIGWLFALLIEILILLSFSANKFISIIRMNVLKK